MILSSQSRLPGNRRRNSQRGYVLLTLLLMVSVMTIVALAIVPTIKFEIRRDQEDEMIHRGVQYSRAIRAYYKKFGRYPTRMEDLENTNNLRFLRKRYKDPITGQDFKLLHYGEVKMGLGGMAGGIPGANPIGGPVNGQTGPGGLSQGSGFGGGSGPGGGSSFGGGSSSFGGGNSGFGGSSNSGFGSNSSSFGSSNSFGSNGQNQQNQPGQTTAGTDASSPSSPSSQTPGQPSDPNAPPQSGPGGSISSGQLAGTTFGGGPIVGVVSSSKKEGIREFNKKKKYAEWNFIYDPSADRGGLIRTPYQPPLQGMMQQLQPGQTQPGSTPTTNGPIPGMMNNPNGGMEPNAPAAPQSPNPQ